MAETKDLTGLKFGKWTVLRKGTKQEKIENWVNPNNTNAWWWCKCECGTVRLVDGSQLRRKSKSCGCIKSLGENKIIQILNKHNIRYKTQYKLCKNEDTNYWLYCDFLIDDKYIIEYDGVQHFSDKNSHREPTDRWNYYRIRYHDILKNEYCKEHNIPLIRIPYTQYDKLCVEDLMLKTTKFLINPSSLQLTM